MSQNSHHSSNLHQTDGQEGFSCEWKAGQNHQALSDNNLPGNKVSVLYLFDNYNWSGVRPEAYKQEPGNFANIVRNIIVGARGESCHFEVRYFEIAEGGFSSLEKHHHEHVIICVRGQGRLRLGREIHHMNFLDIAYISPDTPHQLLNCGKEPFGFFCIVDRERDLPQELAPEDLI
ncbi:MAG: cupin domain-containing protein [bacterium]|nr:cupin domain-containing protein [bacterium]